MLKAHEYGKGDAKKEKESEEQECDTHTVNQFTALLLAPYASNFVIPNSSNFVTLPAELEMVIQIGFCALASNSLVA
jgi:hypothetical protein